MADIDGGSIVIKVRIDGEDKLVKFAEDQKPILDKLSEEYEENAKHVAELEQGLQKLSESGRELTDSEKEQVEQVKEIIGMHKKRAAEIEDEVMAMGSLVDGMNDEASATQKIVEGQKEAVKQTGSFRQRMKELRQEMNELEENGDFGARYREVATELAKMEDAMGDASAMTRHLASDTMLLDEALGGITFGSAIFEGYTAGMQLFGVATEDAEEAQRKLQTAMSLVQSAQAIQNALQHQSSVMQAVARVQDMARIKAENLKAAAIGRTTIAQRIFNKVANANPLGLIVLAVTAAVAAYEALTRVLKRVKESQEEVTEEVKDFYSSVGQSASDNVSKIIELSNAFSKLGDDMNAKKRFIEENKDAFHNLGVEVKSVADAQQLLINQKDDFVRAQVLMAQAEVFRMQAKKIAEDNALIMSINANAPTAKTTNTQYGEMVVESEAEEAARRGAQAFAAGIKAEQKSVTDQMTDLMNKAFDAEEMANKILGAFKEVKKTTDNDKNKISPVKVDEKSINLSKEALKTLSKLATDNMSDGIDKDIQKVKDRYYDMVGELYDFLIENDDKLTDEQRAIIEDAIKRLNDECEEEIISIRKQWKEGLWGPAGKDAEDSTNETVESIEKRLEKLRTKVAEASNYGTMLSNSLASIGSAGNIQAIKNAADVLGDMASMCGQIADGLEEIDGKISISTSSVISIAIQLMTSLVSSAVKYFDTIAQNEVLAEKAASSYALQMLKLNDTFQNGFGTTYFSQITDAAEKARIATAAVESELRVLSLSSSFGKVNMTNKSRWDKFWSGGDEYKDMSELAPWLFNDDGTIKPDMIDSFMDAYGDKLTEEQKQALQLILDLQDSAKSAMETISGYIEDTFGSLGQDGVDAITNAIITGGNAWEEWRKKGAAAIESIGEQMLYEIFMSTNLNQFSNAMKEWMSGTEYEGMSPEERAAKMMDMTSEFMDGMQSSMEAGTDWAQWFQEEAQKRGWNIWGTDSDTLAGSVQNITEQSANVIAGHMNATRLLSIEANNIMREQLLALNQIAQYTRYLQRIDSRIASMQSSQAAATRFTLATN